MLEGSAGNGRTFHVHRMCAIGPPEFLLLFGASNFRIADENGFRQRGAANWGILDGRLVTAAVARIDDCDGKDGLADAQVGREPTCYAGRDQELRRISCDGGFRRTTAGLGADAAAHRNRIATFKESKLAAIVLCLR